MSSLNQTSNGTTLIAMDWSNAFFLNGPLVEYDLFINQKSVYKGILTKTTAPLRVDQCQLNEYTTKGHTLRGYFNILNIQLKARTAYSEETSPNIMVPFNCTASDMLSTVTSSLKPWLYSLIFIPALIFILSMKNNFLIIFG